MSNRSIQRIKYIFVLLVILLIPFSQAVITLDQEVEILNDQMFLNLQVNPNLNLTSQVEIQNDYVQFDDIWFNLTESGGLVDANLTRWDTTDLVTFMINNGTLTDLKVWMNSSEPINVYLDTVDSPLNWTYAGGVLKINATDSLNVTISWLGAPSYYYLTVFFDEGISQISLNGTSKNNGSETSYLENRIARVFSNISDNYVFSRYALNESLNTHSHFNPYDHNMTGNFTVFAYTEAVGTSLTTDYTPTVLWLVVLAMMFMFCIISLFIKIPIIPMVVGIFTIVISIYLTISPPDYLVSTLRISPIIQILLLIMGIITMIFGPMRQMGKSEV